MVLIRFELIYLNIVYPHELNLIYQQHRQPFKVYRFEIINHMSTNINSSNKLLCQKCLEMIKYQHLALYYLNALQCKI